MMMTLSSSYNISNMEYDLEVVFFFFVKRSLMTMCVCVCVWIEISSSYISFIINKYYIYIFIYLIDL